MPGPLFNVCGHLAGKEQTDFPRLLGQRDPESVLEERLRAKVLLPLEMLSGRLDTPAAGQRKGLDALDPGVHSPTQRQSTCRAAKNQIPISSMPRLSYASTLAA